MAKRFWPKIRRLPLWIMFLLIVLVAQRSSYVRVFYEIQRPTATWEVSSVYNNRIGDAMMAKLTIVTPQGMVIDLSRVPDVGEVWDLPYKENPISPLDSLSSATSAVLKRNFGSSITMIDEGKVEVLAREIKQTYTSDEVVTVINFELQYLLPLDWAVPYDDKKLPVFVPVVVQYWYHDLKENVLDRRMAMLDFRTETIFLYQRVDENSAPLLVFYETELPVSPWRHLETLGFGLIGLAALLIVRRCILLMQATLELFTEINEVERKPSLLDYFNDWVNDSQYETFIRAVILFRKEHRDKDYLWWKTTIVLYSGIVFDDRYIRNMFDEMLRRSDV